MTNRDKPKSGILVTRKLDQCRKHRIPAAQDHRGGLAFIEGGTAQGFDIKRVYYLYDVPPRTVRAKHAHRALRQYYIALSGSLKVTLDDGYERKTVLLDKPDEMLYICPGVWREVFDFSTKAVLLVLASAHFEERDYIRDYEVFKKEVEAGTI